MKQQEEAKVDVAEMHMLQGMFGVTRKDRIRNKGIRGNLQVAPIKIK